MNFTVISLFPELIQAWCNTGLVGLALKKEILRVAVLNPREFATDNHKAVDDTAFGGSDGMVMKFEPLAKSIESVLPSHVVFLSPQGERWTQSQASYWQVTHKQVVLVCGRYAGFDQRLIEKYADEEVSVGDYILNGGEIASLAVMESVARLIPGVLGNAQSATRESFSDALLECPAFTRPREIGGMSVPSPLLSGNHAEIAKFEKAVSLVRTKFLRPDLIQPIHEWRPALQSLQKLSEGELHSLGLSRAVLTKMESEK